MSDDVVTVGDLLKSLKELDPSMWVCATVEGHDYPMTISNMGILELNKPFKEQKDFSIFFIDIARQSFVKFVEKEIIDPIMQRAALENESPSTVLQ